MIVWILRPIGDILVKNISTFLTIFIFVGFSNAGSAATYDFALQGNTVEAGYSLFNTKTNPDSIMGANPEVKITASNGGSGLANGVSSVAYGPQISGVAYYAYIDGEYREDGGLGVCPLTDGNCAGNPNDNQKPGEYIHMDFERELVVSSLSITGDHAPVIDNARFWFSLDEGANWDFIDFGINNPLIEVLLPGWVTDTLDYTIQDTVAGDGKEAYMYLSAMTLSEVPVPAAVWLFGTALFGFIAFARRTRV